MKGKDGSEQLISAINELHKAYAKEIMDKIAEGNPLLTDDDLFDKYIKIIGQSSKIRESAQGDGEIEDKVEETNTKDSIFEQMQRKVKKNIDQNGGATNKKGKT